MKTGVASTIKTTAAAPSSFTGVSVNSNTVENNGSAIGAGGGIYVQDDGSGDSMTFSGGSIDHNSTVTNATNGQGGGVYLLNNGTPSTASFSGGTISGNSAYEGGGVYHAGGKLPDTHGGHGHFHERDRVREQRGRGWWRVRRQRGSSSAADHRFVDHQRQQRRYHGDERRWRDRGLRPFNLCDSITLTNDTITGNTAVNGGGYYGAGCTAPTVTTAFTFDTVSGNTATNNAGAGNIQIIDASRLTLAESIVANGSASGGAATNCAVSGGGSLTSGGYNLIDNTNCGSPAAGDIIGKNPLLGSLANNGGPTQTEEPAADSPAVGAIPSATCSGTGVSTDQRGDARGAGANGSCTIGSVEVGGLSSITTSLSPAVITVGGSTQDTATLHNVTSNAGGTVDYRYYATQAACTADTAGSAGTDVGSVTVNNGGVPNSASVTFSTAGTYYFAAFYSGDTNNAKAASNCSTELLTVNKATTPTSGYRFVAADGGIFDYGNATFWGSAGSLHLNAPVVGMAVTPSTNGYWTVASDGGIFNYGDARFFGSMGGRHLNEPIVGMAATADGGGYWLVASDGGIFSFGDAVFHGSAGSMHLNKPIVGMAATPDGGGYWLVASDGGIFSYGDAVFHGSTGSLALNSPVVGMAAGPGGNGYWLVAADGGIFDYGSAHFFGSAGSIRLNKPVVGMAPSADGGGYWLVASDGGIFSYGDAVVLRVDRLHPPEPAHRGDVVDLSRSDSIRVGLGLRSVESRVRPRVRVGWEGGAGWPVSRSSACRWECAVRTL